MSQTEEFFLGGEMLCFEKFEGADLKYHSTVVVSKSSPKYPNKINLFLNLKKFFFARNITFEKLEVVKSSLRIVFSSSSLKTARQCVFSFKFKVLCT